MTYQPQKISGEPLRAHRLFRTRDIDEARQVVSEKFCEHKLIPVGEHETFETCHNHAAGNILSLNYLRYSSEVQIDPGELTDFYLVQIPLCGHAAVQNGAQKVDASQNTATILNPTQATWMTWHKGCEKLLVQINRDAMTDIAQSLTGHRLHRPVVFNAKLRLDRPDMQGWMKKLTACVKAAQSGAAFGDSQYRYQSVIEEDLVAGLLYSQPNAISHLLDRDDGAATTRHVRKAKVYIRENLSEPITLRNIAQHAGCSLRSLQTGFKTNAGCSPMQYLHRQRLMFARYLLQSLPRDTLVSAVAYDAGFTHMGRFAIAYRETFGEMPSETLAKNVITVPI